MECRDPRAFAMLCAAMFFIYSDQNLMAPNLTAIGHFFGYSDDERDAKSAVRQTDAHTTRAHPGLLRWTPCAC